MIAASAAIMAGYRPVLVLNGIGYLLVDWNQDPALLPVPLTSGRTAPATPVAVTGPHPPLAGPDDGLPNWQSVAALPGQGLVFRVPGTGGDDLIAINPTTGTSHLLSHARKGWPLAIARRDVADAMSSTSAQWVGITSESAPDL